MSEQERLEEKEKPQEHHPETIYDGTCEHTYTPSDRFDADGNRYLLCGKCGAGKVECI